ncbi:MAG: DUF3106 domain-containing protein [Burkholderiaceae bacterium]
MNIVGKRIDAIRILTAVLCCVLLTTGTVASAQSTTWPWEQLTDLQKQVLAPFKSQWNQWSTSDKRAWVLLANRFPSLSPDERDRAKKRVVQWAGLTPAQRADARANIRVAKELDQGERLAEWERYKQMTNEQKAVLRKNGRLSSTVNGAAVRSGLANDAAQPLGRSK